MCNKGDTQFFSLANKMNSSMCIVFSKKPLFSAIVISFFFAIFCKVIDVRVKTNTCSACKLENSVYNMDAITEDIQWKNSVYNMEIIT